MELIFIISALAASISMFLVPRVYKVGILLVSYMLFSMVELPVLGIRMNSIISLTLFLSELPSLVKYVKVLFKSKLSLVICASLLTGIISVITSEHLHGVSGLLAFVADEWLFKSFAILYSFFLIHSSRDISVILRLSSYGIAVMSIFAMLNYLLGYSPVCESLFEGSLDGFDFTRTERFRVQSTFINPFDYGFMCLVCFFLHGYGLIARKENLLQAFVCLILCVFGIVTCNCRTILFCLAAGSIIYVCAMNESRGKKLLFLSFFFCLITVAFLFIPSFHKLILSMLTIFDSYSGVDGSSINARVKQLAAVISHIDGNYFFGRGVGYFYLDVGWVNGANSASDHNLLGLEGVFLSLLLERGIVGCLIYIFEMTALWRIIREQRFISRDEYAVSLSIFICYLLFAIMTGELLSLPVTFLLLGCFLGFYFRKRQILTMLMLSRND